MGSKDKLNPQKASTEAKVECCGCIGLTPALLKAEDRNTSGLPRVVRWPSKSETSDGAQLKFKSDAEYLPQNSTKEILGESGRANYYIIGKFPEGKPHSSASRKGKSVKVEAAWHNKPNDVKGVPDFATAATIPQSLQTQENFNLRCFH